MAYQLITTCSAGNEIRQVGGSATDIVLTMRKGKKTRFGFDTIESYETGSITAAKEFQAAILDDERCIDVEITQRPPKITIDVRWAYDVTDIQWTPDQITETWSLEFVETSRPLATHPYFSYSPGIIPDIANCDMLLDLGQPYTATGAFQAQMKRYAGLRYSGVNEWQPVLPVIRRNFRVFKSTTAANWQRLYRNINRSYTTAEICRGAGGAPSASGFTLPVEIAQAISVLTEISYPSSSLMPTQSATSFHWIHKPPSMTMTGRNGNGPRDVTETYVGGQNVSAVLYPNALGTSIDATLWDPQSL